MLAVLRVFFRSRSDTALEVLALRQQVAVLKRKRPRLVLNSMDGFFWTTLCRYWRWRSRPRGGRLTIIDEIRGLIQSLASENLDWGAPKIHGELQKLGFVVS